MVFLSYFVATFSLIPEDVFLGYFALSGDKNSGNIPFAVFFFAIYSLVYLKGNIGLMYESKIHFNDLNLDSSIPDGQYSLDLQWVVF